MSDKNLKDAAMTALMTRRELMVRGATIAVASGLGIPLAGCGGDSAAVDPIWGTGGAADKIQNSLAGIAQAMFPSAVFNVTAYGAKTTGTATYASGYNVFCDTAIATNTVSGSTATMAEKSLNGFGGMPANIDTSGLRFGSTGSVTYVNPTVAGFFDSRPAFIAAINACHAAGGGQVLVPSGNWYCSGPIVLLSNVNFHLAANCTIYFSPNPADYAKDGPFNCGANGNLYYSRWQGNDCLNFGSPIYAKDATNIAVTGTDRTSVLNGQALIPFASTTGLAAIVNGVSVQNPAAPTSINGTSTATCWWTMKGTANTYGFVSTTATPVSQTTPLDINKDLSTLGAGLAPNIYTNGTLNGLYTAIKSTVGGYNTDEKYLPALAEAGVAPVYRVFGLTHYLRPPLIQFIGCTNVLMEGYTTQQSPFWQHNPAACKNVVARNVYIDSVGPNNDGFNPDSCENVLIDGLWFNTGDDCIAIKSGKAGEVTYGPSQNILVQNCTMQSGHGGITIGSEMAAGVQNVYARKITMQNAYWNYNPLWIGIRFKTNMNRGGFIKNVYINGVSLPNGVVTTGKSGGKFVSSALTATTSQAALGVSSSTYSDPSNSQGGILTFDCDYAPSDDPVRIRPPVVNNVQVQNVTAGTPSGGTGSSFQAIVMQGPVAADYTTGILATTPTTLPITNVSISDCDFGTPVNPVTATTPGVTPSAIYAWNVSNVTLSNVKIAGNTLNTTINDAR